MIIDAEPLQQPQQQESHEDEASTATGSAAARRRPRQGKLERDDAAGGFTCCAAPTASALTVTMKRMAPSTNPHEPTTRRRCRWHSSSGASSSSRTATPPWPRPWLRQQEATAAFERWEGAAGCDVTAADPYTYAAFERRMGRPAERGPSRTSLPCPRRAPTLRHLPLELHPPPHRAVVPLHHTRRPRALGAAARRADAAQTPVIEPSTGWRSANEVVHKRCACAFTWQTARGARGVVGAGGMIHTWASGRVRLRAKTKER